MLKHITTAGLCLLALMAGQASAQLPLRLPQLPPVGVPDVGALVPPLGTDVNADLNRAAVRDLRDARRNRIRALLRANRRLLEADPSGAAVVRNELLAYSPTDAALARALASGYTSIRERVLEGLDARIVVLQAPNGMTTRAALLRLRELDPAGTYDFNHLYLESGEITTPPAPPEPVVHGERISAEPGTANTDRDGIRLGLIDSGIDVEHPVFHDVIVHRHGCGGIGVPGPHGTAVASLMIGRTARFHGVAPGSELFAADVYCGLATGGAVDTIAEALSWLAHSGVAVINVSLVGPPNVMLERVVASMIARGHVIVAAVGNDGPAAPPLYPAAYPSVIGVTAVDAHRRALIEAARGPQVKFAAPGADMAAASSPRAYTVVRGTSFASPIVAGLLAGRLHAPDQAQAVRAVADLANSAIDLGDPGPDPVYGYGLVGASLGPEPALARIRE
jgi:subtilisin family serine protease